MHNKIKFLQKAAVFVIAAMLLFGCSQKESSLLLEEAVLEEEKDTEQAEGGTETDSAAFDVNADEGVTEQANCFVHICGAVEKAGVYELPAGSRIFEVIALAGGHTAEACTEYLNQAEKITDGMQIYIPTEEEVQNGAFNTGAEKTAAAKESGNTQEEAEKLININTADKEKLLTLPGIGESRAESIIAYRTENGGFTAIEDIMNISGIKEGAFQKIKDKICVK